MYSSNIVSSITDTFSIFEIKLKINFNQSIRKEFYSILKSFIEDYSQI